MKNHSFTQTLLYQVQYSADRVQLKQLQLMSSKASQTVVHQYQLEPELVQQTLIFDGGGGGGGGGDRETGVLVREFGGRLWELGELELGPRHHDSSCPVQRPVSVRGCFVEFFE